VFFFSKQARISRTPRLFAWSSQGSKQSICISTASGNAVNIFTFFKRLALGLCSWQRGENQFNDGDGEREKQETGVDRSTEHQSSLLKARFVSASLRWREALNSGHVWRCALISATPKSLGFASFQQRGADVGLNVTQDHHLALPSTTIWHFPPLRTCGAC
jgi:hypothetical protein